MSLGKTGVTKRLLAVLLVAVVALSLMPTFAANSQAYAADGLGLTVYYQIGATGEKVKAKEYTAAQLEALVDVPARSVGYLYVRGGWQLVTPDKGVKLQTIFADAGIALNAGDSLIAADTTSSQQGAYTYTYEQLSSWTKFFPAVASTPNEPNAGVDTKGALEVPAILALSSFSGAVSQTASVDLATIAAAGDSNRIFLGSTEADIKGSTATGSTVGKRLWSNVSELTIVKGSADLIPASAVALLKTKYTATGKQVKPDVKVTVNNLTLKEGIDYTITNAANILGKGSTTISGKGLYYGTVVKDIVINPRATSAKKITAGKKKLTVKWKAAKDGVSGYEIQAKTGSKIKTIKVGGKAKVSKVISGLKKGKKYSVKIRAYYKSGSKTYNSAWSKTIKSAKIK